MDLQKWDVRGADTGDAVPTTGLWTTRVWRSQVETAGDAYFNVQSTLPTSVLFLSSTQGERERNVEWEPRPSAHKLTCTWQW